MRSMQVLLDYLLSDHLQKVNMDHRSIAIDCHLNTTSFRFAYLPVLPVYLDHLSSVA